jgi:hypothetical protein
MVEWKSWAGCRSRYPKTFAKEALTTDSVNLEINQVVASDHSKMIKDRLKLNHQFDYFDNSEFNKLRQIQPDINCNADLGLFSRKHVMLITRLKIGHTYFGPIFHKWSLPTWRICTFL